MEKAASGESTARAARHPTSTARVAAGIECGGLQWRSAHLPYLAGGSPHGRIERRRGVDPQEAARRLSITTQARKARKRWWREVRGDGRDLTGRRRIRHRRRRGGSEMGETAGTSRATGARWIERREVGMGERREIPGDGGEESRIP
jgi:hypothetical protein